MTRYQIVLEENQQRDGRYHVRFEIVASKDEDDQTDDAPGLAFPFPQAPNRRNKRVIASCKKKKQRNNEEPQEPKDLSVSNLIRDFLMKNHNDSCIRSSFCIFSNKIFIFSGFEA